MRRWPRVYNSLTRHPPGASGPIQSLATAKISSCCVLSCNSNPSHPIREDFQSGEFQRSETLPPRSVPGNSRGKRAGSEFPWAAVAKCHTLGGLKQQGFDSLTDLEPEVWNELSARLHALQRLYLGESLFLVSSRSVGWLTFLGFGPQHSNLCLCCHILFSSVYLISFFLPPTEGYIRLHSGSPR